MGPRKKKKTKRTENRKESFNLRDLPGFLSRHPWTVLMVVNLAMGLVWMIRVQPSPFSDYLAYYKLAGHLLDHQQFGWPEPTARRLPGYPAFLAIPMLISRSVMWLGFVNLLLNALLIPVVYKLVLVLKPDARAVALLSAGLCAFNPTFVFFSPLLASEHLFVLLVLVPLLITLTPGGRANVRLILAGLILGWAVLTRGEALFYLPVVVLCLWSTAEGSWRTRVRRVALLAGVILATVTPWLVRNHVVIGAGVGLSTVGGVNFYYAHNNTKYGYHSLVKSGVNIPHPGERQRYWYRRGWDNIREDPRRLLRDTAAGTKALLIEKTPYAVHAPFVRDLSGTLADLRSRDRRYPWGAEQVVRMFYGFLLFGTVAGVFLVRRIGIRNFAVLYGVVAMNWLCYAVVFWAKPRYRYTSEATMCIVAAFVLAWVWGVGGNIYRRIR
jgi:hypothetical protein